MKLKLNNCNSIDNGEIEIIDGCLNIKYGTNGTGKTTLTKTIDIFVNDKDKTQLIPFKYRDNPEEHMPNLIGYKNYKSIVIFNEEYINSYVFQPNELMKNSFEVFVKNKDYDNHLKEIEKLLSDVTNTFKNHSELDELIIFFERFIESFGKANSGYSRAGAIEKGIGKGNKIENIPNSLLEYEPYLKNELNVTWLKWQLDGKQYLNITDKCPYCLSPLNNKLEKIFELNDNYNSKEIDNLNKILEIFNSLLPYLSDDTKTEVVKILKNVSNINQQQINYLIEIKTQVKNFLTQLHKLKNIGFYSLRNVEKISDELKSYRIDNKLSSHLKSDLMNEKISIINSTLDKVLEKAGILQGEIARQKNNIKKTIETYSNEINEFLYYAGYKYSVSIEETTNTNDYKLILKHQDSNESIETAREHLSYGERNAFSLVLFMYSSLKENPDLIVLDDPISSFDGNKKYAIINMLFTGKKSFQNKTVLMLTHEFNSVIDIIHNLYYKFSTQPNATFLNNNDGILLEQPINKHDINSFIEIAYQNINSNINSLNKLVYLRRLFELTKPRSLPWQLLSNIFHKREIPIIKENNLKRDMTKEEIELATKEIQEYIKDFNYQKEYEKTKDNILLKKLYLNSNSNYEKLQIYRIIFNQNNDNDVIKKFVNETYHIENDYLFQLNPSKYNTVPKYIIDICNKDINKI